MSWEDNRPEPTCLYIIRLARVYGVCWSSNQHESSIDLPINWYHGQPRAMLHAKKINSWNPKNEGWNFKSSFSRGMFVQDEPGVLFRRGQNHHYQHHTFIGLLCTCLFSQRCRCSSWFSCERQHRYELTNYLNYTLSTKFITDLDWLPLGPIAWKEVFLFGRAS